MRQNSTTSLLRTTRPSESTLYIPESKRRSQDDSESSKGMVYSGSSTHSGDLRKAKSSLNLNPFAKLKSRSSKTHLRSDSDGTEHPSLKPPVPPLPEQRHGNNLFNGLPITIPVASASTMTIQASTSKKSKGKKRDKAPPTPPPKGDGQEFTGDLDLNSMEGILDPKIISAGHANSVFSHPSSPSSGSQSHSDHSSHYPYFEFSDPFSTTPLQDKRKAMIAPGDYRKVSPKTIMPPDSCPSIASASSLTLVPGSPTGSHKESWVPPESWAVGTAEGQNHDSDHDSDVSLNGLSPALSGKIPRDKLKSAKKRNMASASFSSVASTTSRGSKSTLRGSHYHPLAFRVRISKPGNTASHIISTDLVTTVAELTTRLSKMGPVEKNPVQHNLYLSQQGRGKL